jgi:hypothetical protein
MNECPFTNIGINGESGKECQVGSISCKECKFCYWAAKSKTAFIPINDKLRLSNVQYVKCMFVRPTWYKKCIQFIFKLKQLF